METSAIKQDGIWKGMTVTNTGTQLKFRGIEHFPIFILKSYPVTGGDTIYFAKKRGGSGWAGRGMSAYYGTEYMLIRVNGESNVSKLVYTGEFGMKYRAGMKEMLDTYLPKMY